jgi:hypothetical protein
MLSNKRPILISALIYILIIYILYEIKPEQLFINGKAKQFGVGKDKTLFPIYIISLIISIFSLIYFRISPV